MVVCCSQGLLFLSYILSSFNCLFEMPEFALKTDPEKNVVFVSDKLGEESVIVTLKLTNSAPKDVVFKVKCTSNEMFRIRPPMGILSHMKCENVRVSDYALSLL